MRPQQKHIHIANALQKCTAISEKKNPEKRKRTKRKKNEWAVTHKTKTQLRVNHRLAKQNKTEPEKSATIREGIWGERQHEERRIWRFRIYEICGFSTSASSVHASGSLPIYEKRGSLEIHAYGTEDLDSASTKPRGPISKIQNLSTSVYDVHASFQA